MHFAGRRAQEGEPRRGRVLLQRDDGEAECQAFRPQKRASGIRVLRLLTAISVQKGRQAKGKSDARVRETLPGSRLQFCPAFELTA